MSTRLQKASLHSTSSQFVKHYPLLPPASSTTRLNTPGPSIYDISAISPEDICEGCQLPGLGNSCRLFNVNQLNRERFRDLPRGVLRRWGILCDTGAITSVTPRNFADHVPLQPHTTHNSHSLQQPINLFASMATETSCLFATTSASQCSSTSATSRPHCWDYTTSLTAK